MATTAFMAKTSTLEVPLVLGGHSFIGQLGNDPAPDAMAQRDIVEACVNAGICWFDTTYQPERVALGKALKSLGVRSQVTILAWNFFKVFSKGEEVGGANAYLPGRLDVMLEELQTDYLDYLVVHRLDDQRKDEAQLQVALEWQRQGRVRKLGCWNPDETSEQNYGQFNPFSLMVRPYNIVSPPSTGAFQAGKRLGWQTLACSPFVRGWELDAMVKRASERLSWTEEDARQRMGDYMLRYSLFGEGIDRLIVSMRRVAWVVANVESVKRGPLTSTELTLLQQLTAHEPG